MREKRGRDINNKAGIKSFREVCYLESWDRRDLIGFFYLRVTASLTDRQTIVHRLAHINLHMLYVQHMEQTVGGTII